MFRQITFFDNFTDSITATWSAFLFQGLASVLLGFAILLFPQLLVAMVAASFIFFGMVSIIVAWKTRGLKKRYSRWRDEFWEPV